MTPTALRTFGSRRLGVLLLSGTLGGGTALIVPTVVLAAGPSVTISIPANQANPTNRSPIRFTVDFSDPVEGFTAGDVAFTGPSGNLAGGTKVATVSGGPSTYDVSVTGMTTSGYVNIAVPAGSAFNPAAEPNVASTENGFGIFWWRGPFVTINPAVGQADPTGTSPINFTVVFTDPVEDFTSGDVVIEGSAGGTKTATVTGGPKTFNVAVAGMTAAGSVHLRVPAGAGFNPAGEPNLDSTFTDYEVIWTPGGPSVTVNQAVGQADPTGTSPITFAAVFIDPVNGFTGGDVTISGTAGGTKTATVTGSGTTYNIAVTGMTTPGTVTATVPADVVMDASNRPNKPSTSTDNTVTWSPAAPGGLTLATSAPIPPGAKDPVILWGQGFTLGVEFGTTGANRAVQLQGTRDGAAWTTITTLTTDASGRASLVYRPVTNLFYRAVFSGTPDLVAATSNQVRTVVRQLAVVRPTNRGSTKAISRNASLTFTTTVRPSRPELAPPTVTFSFYHQVSGVWRLATTRVIAVDSAGKASTTFQFSSSGQWYVRSQAGPTPYNANSVPTPAERYSVR